MNVDELNNDALPSAEKQISDVLVPGLFFPSGECQTVAQSRFRHIFGLATHNAEDKVKDDKLLAQKWAMDLFEDKQKLKPRGSRTTGWDIPSGEETPSGHRWLLGRNMQEENELVGLTASPPDLVIRGRLQSK